MKGLIFRKMLRNVKVFLDTKMVLEIIDRLIELDNEMLLLGLERK